MVSNNGSAEWAFWAETVDGVARRVESSVDGLSTVEAERRLQRLRREAPVRRREPWWRLLLSQFTSPIVLTLIVAGGISAFLRDVSDALIILGIVLVSGLLGFWQEKGSRTRWPGCSIRCVSPPTWCAMAVVWSSRATR